VSAAWWCSEALSLTPVCRCLSVIASSTPTCSVTLPRPPAPAIVDRSRGRFEIDGTFENHGKVVHCVSFMFGAPRDSPKPSEVASSGSKFARAWCEQLQHRIVQIEDVRDCVVR